jgi:threonine dehydrogenase-like Zn-dependent dehydrogenase
MYAKAMGCEVVVFSSSDAKAEDAKALGATEYFLLNSKTEVALQASGVNVVLLCGGGLPDFKRYDPEHKPFKTLKLKYERTNPSSCSACRYHSSCYTRESTSNSVHAVFAPWSPNHVRHLQGETQIY